MSPIHHRSQPPAKALSQNLQDDTALGQAPQSQTNTTNTQYATTSKDFFDKLTAWSAAAAAIFTFALVIIGYCGVKAAVRTLSAIKEQTRATKASVKAFIESERPWVKIKLDPAGVISWNDAGILAPVNITIENIGKTPALEVDVWPVFYCLGGPHDMYKKRDELSRIIRARRPAPMHLAAFQNEPQYINIHLFSQDNTLDVQTMRELGSGIADVIYMVAIIWATNYLTHRQLAG